MKPKLPDCPSVNARFSRRALLAGAAAGIVASAIPIAFARDGLPPFGTRRGATTVRGKTVAWRVEAGEVALPVGAANIEATIFSVAYLAEGIDPARRPVTFVWNGGPGSATWHLREDLSPRITVAATAEPRYAFSDNKDSIVDATDLVFIDAPGIGFSRIVDRSAKARYHGVEEDGRAFSEFIAAWLTRNGRLASPVYLMGESYGGTRIGQVARGLGERAIAIKGAVLISPSTSEESSGGTAFNLPPQACIAWYHKRGVHVGTPLDRLAREVEAFAAGPYAAALAREAVLSPAERRAIAERVADYTGFSAEYVMAHGLAVPEEAFNDLLLADKGLRVSGYDGRETHRKLAPGEVESAVDADGSFDRTASIEALIRKDIGYQAVGAYTRDPAVTDPWNRTVERTANVGEILGQLARSNPQLRVLLVAGYYDTVVPYSQPLGVLKSNLPPDRFEYRIYPVGHAVYGDEALRPDTTGDLARWYARG